MQAYLRPVDAHAGSRTVPGALAGDGSPQGGHGHGHRGISGPRAQPKGLRHDFGGAAAPILTDITTAVICTTAIGVEARGPGEDVEGVTLGLIVRICSNQAHGKHRKA